jgi:hypothetical protein
MTTNHAVGIKEMTDPLVARLRSGFVTETEMREAADEIERLIHDIERHISLAGGRLCGT